MKGYLTFVGFIRLMNRANHQVSCEKHIFAWVDSLTLLQVSFTRCNQGSRRRIPSRTRRDASDASRCDGAWRKEVHYVTRCRRKLGSMVSKWVISPTYKWSILGL